MNQNIEDAREGQAALIMWVDSSMRPGWLYGKEVDAEVKKIESIGFVCAVSPEALTITCSHSDTGGVVSPVTIPKCCILECRLIDL